MNIQSTNSKYDALLAILSELYENNINIYAICLQETRLSADQDVAVYDIPGCQLISQGHSCSAHSGLIIFLADFFSYLIKSVHINSKLWDGLFIQVTGESMPEKVIIGNLCRPTRHINSNETIKQFCHELAPIISKVSKNSSHVIITSDLLQINKRSEYQKYFDLFVTHGLFPKITIPTRCDKSSSSLIEQMFCKLKDPKQHLSSRVVKSCILDHFPYLFIFDILKKIRHAPKFVKINHTDADSFQHFIMKLNHNLIPLKWTAICFVIQMKIISVMK